MIRVNEWYHDGWARQILLQLMLVVASGGYDGMNLVPWQGETCRSMFVLSASPVCKSIDWLVLFVFLGCCQLSLSSMAWVTSSKEALSLGCPCE